MSNYTTEVRHICETAYGLEESTGFNDIQKIIEGSREKIFNFDYPIFDESYRPTLETLILRHFYTREIGFETVGLWELKLCDKLNVIMPYYNKWYESELLDFNPLWDTDFTRKGTINDTNKSESNSTINGTITDTGSNTSTSTSKNTSKYSDTPQGSISELENGTYLTNATITDNTGNSSVENSNTNTNNTTNTGKTEAKNLNEYSELVQGNRGVFDNGTMLKHFRETFTNINKMVLDELEDLFILLW